jgi:Flp pilus assembly pilin Flp
MGSMTNLPGGISRGIWARVRGFVRDERGTETLEWGLVCGLLVVGAITAIGFIGPKITDMWNDVNNAVPNAD